MTAEAAIHRYSAKQEHLKFRKIHRKRPVSEPQSLATLL